MRKKTGWYALEAQYNSTLLEMPLAQSQGDGRQNVT